MWPLLFFFATDLTTVIVETLAFLIIFFFTVSVIRHYSSDLHVTIRDFSKKHNWRETQLSEKPCFCAVCESLLVSGEGAYCDCCGLCADMSCVTVADKNLQCKPVTSKEGTPTKHLWVKGNVQLDAVCCVCDEDCEGGPGHLDRQCCWCQRTVHSHCERSLPEECDFGPFRSLIVPPSSVVLSKQRRIRTSFHVRAVTPPPWDDWSPLIVVANQKSGSNDGDNILSLFRRMLNPAQVVNLAHGSPEAALDWCNLLGDVRAKVLVAGGDGTIGWVLNTIDKLRLKHNPPVAIVPLGTGNDLSRVLGWGNQCNANTLDPATVLEHILNAVEVQLDRWEVSVKPARHLGIKMRSKKMFMYNYLSVGVDAQVALDFHRTRESPFYLFSSRIFNKCLYLGYGTQQAVERSYQELEKRIELYIDKERADLPSIESVVILNIPCWGAGVYLWSMGDEAAPDQSISDERLELCALYSSFHIAQLQMGLSQSHRIGQGREVTIVLKSAMAVQVDGEPWWQPPGEINITFRNQASMLQFNRTS